MFANMYVFESVCVSCVFSLLFFQFVCFVLFLFVCFYFFLLYYYYEFLDVGCFLMREREQERVWICVSGEVLRGVVEGEAIIRIYFMKKSSFNYKIRGL